MRKSVIFAVALVAVLPAGSAAAEAGCTANHEICRVDCSVSFDNLRPSDTGLPETPSPEGAQCRTGCDNAFNTCLRTNASAPEHSRTAASGPNTLASERVLR